MTESKPYTVFTVGRDGITLRVTLPLALAAQVGIRGKDKVTWELDTENKRMILRKARV